MRETSGRFVRTCRIAALLALAIAAWGCNSRLIRPPATIFVDGGEYTIDATSGERPPAFSATFFSFFPSHVPLHPGDTVRFELRSSGEPHSVALGTLVDKAVRAIEKARPASAARAEAIPEVRAVPSLLPRSPRGEPTLNASAAQPCYIDEGRPPAGNTACPARSKPDFDGTHVFYSTGYLEEGESFRLKLSPDTPPGRYAFMCLVHRAAMTGTLEVRSTDEPRPPVSVLKREASDELRNLASTLVELANETADPPAGSVIAGAGRSGLVRGYLSDFSPERLRTRVGAKVGWRLFGMHAIAFNPPRDAVRGLVLEDSGSSLRLNDDAWEPAGGSPAPAPAARVFPPPAGSGPITIDGGTWDGEGFFSSGILRSAPPATITYRLAFREPGRYGYRCLVHPAMAGVIDVAE